jgi:2,4-diketo-3-deoxy-L-fuconate hydrolase
LPAAWVGKKFCAGVRCPSSFTASMLSLAHDFECLPADGSNPAVDEFGSAVRSPVPVLAQGRLPGGESVPWMIFDDRALPLHDWAGVRPLGRAGSVTDLVANWTMYEADLRALTTSAATRDLILTRGCDVGSLTLEAPIRPRNVFCTIGNYRAQIVEAALDAGDGPDGPCADSRRRAALDAMQQRVRTGEPYVCLTSSSRVAPPDGTLSVSGIDTLDWEVEIAAVMVSAARNSASGDAAHAIAGYCVANDLTIRARITRQDVPNLSSDWLQSKGMPGSLPLGPWFVPAWHVTEVAELRLRLWVNDTKMQDEFASDMLFSVEQQISYLSKHTTLQSGDVICTGSPAGFGAHHGRYLRAGDVVTAEVSGLGRQRLRCVDVDLSGGRGSEPLATSVSRRCSTVDRMETTHRTATSANGGQR